MSKVTLNTIGSRYGSLDALNDNFDQLENAMENTLSRDGTGPNSMEAPLDMGANPILNASVISTGALVIGGQTVVPGGEVTVSTSAVVIEFVATSGQTTKDVSPLTPTTNSLQLVVNGLEIPTSTISTSGSIVTFPPLSDGDEVLIRIFTANIGGVTNIGMGNLIKGTTAEDVSGGATDSASYRFRRRATYSGGTPGFVNAALFVDTFVESAPGLASTATSFEWSLVSVMHNRSPFGENVAQYAQGIKYAGAGPTWASCHEIIDWNTNPTSGAVGMELSYTANGGDSLGSRVAFDLALRRRDAGGAAATLGWGYRIQSDAGSIVDRGFAFVSGTTVNKGFDTSLATVTQAAYVMAENQPIAFNAALSRKLYHNGSGFQFTNTANVSYWSLNDNGSLVGIGGLQLLGTRRTGWGAPTGTATRTAFATGSVTLPQLAERVKALIDDLTAHGLIGA